MKSVRFPISVELFAFAFLAFFGGSVARASESATLTGVPLVLDSGTIMINGTTLHLWGIAALAEDQQCWHGQNAWHCGEQATIALKHFVENQPVICEIKDENDDGKPSARCTFEIRDHTFDMARFLIRHGWAMDDDNESEGLYAEDQKEAQRRGRGIWTSRFQTAEDWREGVQRFVGE